MYVSGLDPRCGPESPGGTSQKYWLSPQETWFPLLGICVLKAFQDEKHFGLLFEAGTKLYFSCTKAVHTARPHAPGDRSLGDVLVTRNPQPPRPLWGHRVRPRISVLSHSWVGTVLPTVVRHPGGKWAPPGSGDGEHVREPRFLKGRPSPHGGQGCRRPGGWAGRWAEASSRPPPPLGLPARL